MEFIYPDWPAPAHVKALTTTRQGGLSVGPYASLNLSNRVGDNAEHVRGNRALLHQTLALPSDPLWLVQVHGNRVIDAFDADAQSQADACVTSMPGIVCAVLTADCLPVFLCDRSGTRVGLIHAGWRGLAAGIIEEGLRQMRIPAGNLLAWLGPAIGPSHYEVGAEVRQAFVAQDAQAAQSFTPVPARHGHWFANLYDLARRRLRLQGVHSIYGGSLCTYREHNLFFSYRHHGICGRMASLIWLDKSAG